MDHGMPTADGPNGQLSDLQLVADVHGPARRAQRGGGLRIGVQRGIGVALEQRRQPRDVDVVRVLVRDQDCGQAGDSLEAVREVTGIKEQAGVVELGK
jgi:hypothetical protein